VLVRPSLRIGAKRGPIALAMVVFVEAVERRAVDAEQRRLPIGFIEPVEVDQKAHHAVPEAMRKRLQPRMHHLAEIKRRGGLWTGVVASNAHRYSAASANSAGVSRQGA
jgi:hypothetical protein